MSEAALNTMPGDGAETSEARPKSQRSLHRLYWITAVCLCVLWAGAALTVRSLTQDIGYARTNVSENFIHLASQTEWELTSLIDYLDRLRLREPGLTAADVQERFEVFLGRMDAAQVGEVAKAYDQIEDGRAVLEQTSTVLDELQPAFHTLSTLDVPEIEAIKARLRQLVPGMHTLSLRVMHWQAAHRTRTQEVRDELQTYFLVWLGASLGLSIVVCSLLWSEKRRLSLFSGALMQTVKRRTAELVSTESRFRATVEASPAQISMRDHDGNYVMVNRAWLASHNVSESEVLGRSPRDLASPIALAEQEAASRECLEQARVVQFETQYAGSDGQQRHLSVVTYPIINAVGTVDGVGEVATDVTSQRETEAQLRQAHKMEAIGNLTGGVAHDFNNLLAIIIGNTEMMERRAAKPDALLSAVKTAAVRGADLTSRLLSFSRRQPLRSESIDVAALMDELTTLLPSSLGPGVAVSVANCDGLWELQADRTQLESALLNLAVNARDAMRGEGRLTIRCENLRAGHPAGPVEVRQGNFVALHVSDDGPGMPPNVKAQAFEPFFTTKETGRGSGLGLSMVYGFVKQSGGHATITSHPGAGTTVSLFLPKASSNRAPATISDSEEVPSTGKDRLVLLLEDEEEVRKVTCLMLKGLGYRVVCAADAADARDILAGLPAPPDVLLTDVLLPGGVSGPAFADEFKATCPDVPVVFMSGYPRGGKDDDAPLPREALFVRKPFTRAEMGALLSATCEARKA